jgi:hypothetical protein
MKKEENGEKTDIVRLFIVLVVLSAVGFGVGAAYLYRTQTACADQFEQESAAMSNLKRYAETSENTPYWGPESKGAGKTTGADLKPYLSEKAKSNGIPYQRFYTKQKLFASKGYKETKVTLRTTDDATLERIIRFLYNVQRGRKDVHIESLTLSGFDYEVLIPTCKATIEFLVFEEMKIPPKK